MPQSIRTLCTDRIELGRVIRLRDLQTIQGYLRQVSFLYVAAKTTINLKMIFINI
jgi:hypothetical protein